jgi:hypothetical protein
MTDEQWTAFTKTPQYTIFSKKFQEWKEKFGVTYGSPEEEQERFKAYVENQNKPTKTT